MIFIVLGFHGMMTKVKTMAFDLGEVVCSGWLSGDFVVLDQASSFTSIWNTSSQKSSVGST